MNALRVYMYLDEGTVNRYVTVSSGAQPSTRSIDIDNKHFAGYVVPFGLDEENALKKYARAYNAWSVKGPPVLLVSITIPANFALQHFLDQEIKVMDYRPEATVGFTMPVNTTNYPSMKPQVTEIDVPGAPEELLRAGYELLS